MPLFCRSNGTILPGLFFRSGYRHESRFFGSFPVES